MSARPALQGWIYSGCLICASLILVSSLGALKFFVSDKLAPKANGLSGVTSGPGVDLLLIGSSHTRLSYDMHIVEKATGDDRSYLCSYGDADLRTIAQILDYLVNKPGRKPEYVVVEAYSFLLSQRPDLQDPRLYFDAPPPLKAKIVRDYFESRRSFSSLLDLFDLTVNRGNDQILAYPAFVWAERTASYRGGRRAIVAPGVTEDEFRRFSVGKQIGEPNPVQVQAFHRIAALARQKNMHILFVESPMPSPVSSNAGIQRMKKWLRALATQEGYAYIDGDIGFPVDEPGMFTDNNHLSAKGRELFSERMGAVLKSWMDQTRGPAFEVLSTSQ